MATEEEMAAAALAGWNMADGDPPYVHSLPPDIDPELGDNGIPPSSAAQTA